jgi:predicted ATPase/DNA-binding SARP family transcriptional activator
MSSTIDALTEGDRANSGDTGFFVQLFGAMAVRSNGQLLPKMRTRKDQWLLALLVLHAIDSPVERLWLAGTLWPEASEAAAQSNLRRSLSILRDALGAEAGRILSPTPRTLRIDMTGAQSDVTAFDAAARRNDEESLVRAVEQYRSPLLLGCVEEWVVPLRDTRQQAVIRILEKLAGLARERDDQRSAADYLVRAHELDPHRETTVRDLMATLAAQGRHAAAAETFRRFRQRLHRDIHAEPDPETIRLHRQVLREGRLRAESSQADTRDTQSPREGDSATTDNGLLALNRKPALPAPLTDLIGREQEVKDVVSKLADHRLVTLTGPGGVGKTRLAVAAAAAAEEDGRFYDGIYFFRLAPLLVADVLVPTIVAALLGNRAADALKASVSQNNVEAPLLHALRDRHVLLVWDNCEHLLEETARLAGVLLQACPHVHVLATSRQSLGEQGEVVVPVEPLAERDAAALFAERASSASGGQFAADANDRAVVQICRLVQGMPLALEMAAAWANALSLNDIASRLADQLRLLLPADPRASDRRQPRKASRRQTLDTVLEGSFRLLEADEATLLRALSCFSGGWTLSDAARLTEDDELNTLDTLAQLVDKSLIYRERPAAQGTDAADSRYDMLTMVAQYTRDRALKDEADTSFIELQNRHRDLFLDLVETAKPHLAGGREQAYWLNRLDADHNNMRAALRHCRDQIARDEPDGAAKGLRIAAALGPFWSLRGYIGEGIGWLDAMITAGQPDDAAYPEACFEACGFLTFRGDLAAATRYGEAALTAYERRGNENGRAATLLRLSYIHLILGHADESATLLGKALALQQRTGDQSGEAATREQLAYVARESGRFAVSAAHLTEAVRLYRQIGNRTGEASALGGLGAQFATQGNYASARSNLERSLQIYRTVGVRAGQSWCLASLADVERESGNLPEAHTLLEQALTINQEIDNQGGVAWNLTTLADIIRRLGDLATARQTAERALRTARDAGMYSLEPQIYLALSVVARDQGDIDRATQHGRAALRISIELGQRVRQVDALETIAAVYWSTGRQALASRLFGAAAAERSRQRTTLSEARATALHGRTAAQEEWPTEWSEGAIAPFSELAQAALAEDGNR